MMLYFVIFFDSVLSVSTMPNAFLGSQKLHSVRLWSLAASKCRASLDCI